MLSSHPIYGSPPPCGQCADTTTRLREALAERDSARMSNDRKVSLRQEVADALGVADLGGEAQFAAALTAIRALIQSDCALAESWAEAAKAALEKEQRKNQGLRARMQAGRDKSQGRLTAIAIKCDALWREQKARAETAEAALREIDREVVACFGAEIPPPETLAGIIRRIVAQALKGETP